MAPQKPVFVIATRNAGKTAEIRDLLQGFPVEIRDLSDFGPIPAGAEDGQTFDENAYQKSSFTARVLGYPALADDSGLAEAALNGAPGVFSARYGGDGLSDADRCQKLLAEMNGRSDRRAAVEAAADEEVDVDAVAAASAKVDAWTVKVAEFATAKDGQLDLKEALPK